MTSPQVMWTIDPTLNTPGEDLMKAYADQLDAAGLEATGEPTGRMEAHHFERARPDRRELANR